MTEGKLEDFSKILQDLSKLSDYWKSNDIRFFN